MMVRLGCLYSQRQPKAGSLQDKVGMVWLRDDSARPGGCQILGLCWTQQQRKSVLHPRAETRVNLQPAGNSTSPE